MYLINWRNFIFRLPKRRWLWTIYFWNCTNVILQRNLKKPSSIWNQNGQKLLQKTTHQNFSNILSCTKKNRLKESFQRQWETKQMWNLIIGKTRWSGQIIKDEICKWYGNHKTISIIEAIDGQNEKHSSLQRCLQVDLQRRFLQVISSVPTFWKNLWWMVLFNQESKRTTSKWFFSVHS